MVTFRNNNRRNNFRRNDRNFKSNGDRQKFSSSFSNTDNFKRKVPGRNNHNAPKLIEKYNDLAREASSNGDKILSENYLQHADHFTRVLNERESFRKEKSSENATDNKDDKIDNNEKVSSEIQASNVKEPKDSLIKDLKTENESEKNAEPQV